MNRQIKKLGSHLGLSAYFGQILEILEKALLSPKLREDIRAGTACESQITMSKKNLQILLGISRPETSPGSPPPLRDQQQQDGGDQEEDAGDEGGEGQRLRQGRCLRGAMQGGQGEIFYFSCFSHSCLVFRFALQKERTRLTS